MVRYPTDNPGTRSVRADLHYIVNTGVKPRTYISAEDSGKSTYRENKADVREVEIRDGRQLLSKTRLDQEGFELHRLSSAVSDFYDDEDVKLLHYAEISDLIRRTTGAARVSIFDHVRRAAGGKKFGARIPVCAVHNDYTPVSAPQIVRDLFPDECDDLLGRRFAVINAWHSIHERIETFPLAVCDARSIQPGDFVATDLVYKNDGGEVFTRAQSAKRVGEIFNLAYNPSHRWYYFPRMAEEDVLLFKCFDSATDGRTRLTAHTAFVDPDADADAAPRQSIELRALAFFR